jgi:hypothetical protein
MLTIFYFAKVTAKGKKNPNRHGTYIVFLSGNTAVAKLYRTERQRPATSGNVQRGSTRAGLENGLHAWRIDDAEQHGAFYQEG